MLSLAEAVPTFSRSKPGTSAVHFPSRKFQRSVVPARHLRLWCLCIGWQVGCDSFALLLLTAKNTKKHNMTTRKSRWGPHRANSCKRWLHRLATTSLARNTCIFYAFVLVASLSGRPINGLAVHTIYCLLACTECGDCQA